MFFRGLLASLGSRPVLRRLTDPGRYRLVPSRPGRVLDLGCGSKKYPGAFGVDISADTDADLVVNLDEVPYPLEDSSFDHVLMQDVIEHLENPYDIMAEVHRVLAPAGRVTLRTPHFSSALAYGDPTHKHALSAAAIRSLADPGFAHYSAARFRVLWVRIDLWLPFRVLGIEWLANRYPDLYEKYFAFRFTAMNLRAELEVIK
jgi:SAM-dependent methyltransferase